MGLHGRGPVDRPVVASDRLVEVRLVPTAHDRDGSRVVVRVLITMWLQVGRVVAATGTVMLLTNWRMQPTVGLTVTIGVSACCRPLPALRTLSSSALLLLRLFCSSS